jgi:hypothetical protein
VYRSSSPAPGASSLGTTYTASPRDKTCLSGSFPGCSILTTGPGRFAAPRPSGRSSCETRHGKTPPGSYGGSARRSHWIGRLTTHLSNDEQQPFQVTHPFHPLSGKTYNAEMCHKAWGEERVYSHNEAGELVSIPLAWTNLAPQDPFVHFGEGRAAFRLSDLLEIVRLLKTLCSEETDEA